MTEKRVVEIGLLYSRSSSSVLIAEASRAGALATIAAVNADQYGPCREQILRDSTARHVIGCVTPWSRRR